MRIGLYPGTFDPVTLGHTDIIQRAMALVDRLVIGVAINRDKGPLFSLEERVAMVNAECAAIVAKTGGEIVVHPFENLLIDCARDVGAGVIIRGLRAVADFEYEFQMVGMNRALDASIETVFMMADAPQAGDCVETGQGNRAFGGRCDQIRADPGGGGTGCQVSLIQDRHCSSARNQARSAPGNA